MNSKFAKFISVLLVFLGFSWGLLGTAKHFWRGETLSQSKVEARWGTAEFDSEAFKKAEISDRAKMAANLLRNQKSFVGKKRSEIRKELGSFDGFYFSDMFPTYIIQRGKNHQEETWQIVFLLDRKENVSEIIVHKNCCDN